jgi:hypothetical protein
LKRKRFKQTRTAGRDGNPLLQITFAIPGLIILGLAGLPPVDAQSPPPRPLYVSIPLGPRVAPTPISADIVLTDQTGAASAGNVNDAIDRFPARAAEAIRWTTFHSDFPPPDGLGFLQDIKADGDNNEENLGFSLLAKMAYKDYFNDDAGATDSAIKYARNWTRRFRD